MPSSVGDYNKALLQLVFALEIDNWIINMSDIFQIADTALVVIMTQYLASKSDLCRFFVNIDRS